MGKKYIKQNKKAQEEVMGFVIIVLIVIIISVVFFAFSLRKMKHAEEQKQYQLEDFLNAMLMLTTECKSNEKNLSVREMIRLCNNRGTCYISGTAQDSCKALNKTLNTVLTESIGDSGSITNAYIHGYELNITADRELVYIKQGNLSGNSFASTVAMPSLEGGDIILKLRYYYSKQA